MGGQLTLSDELLVNRIKNTYQGVQVHTKLFTFALLIAGGLLSSSQAGAQVPQSYTFTDLGAVGGRDSLGQAINNSGDVAGVLRIGTRSTRAIVWQETTATTLESLGGPRAEATDINNRGQVAGWATLPSLSGTLPTIWSD